MRDGENVCCAGRPVVFRFITPQYQAGKLVEIYPLYMGPHPGEPARVYALSKVATLYAQLLTHSILGYLLVNATLLRILYGA
jgi:hypothetical protein